MRSEKVCGLARELPSKLATFANTHADQCISGMILMNQCFITVLFISVSEL